MKQYMVLCGIGAKPVAHLMQYHLLQWEVAKVKLLQLMTSNMTLTVLNLHQKTPKGATTNIHVKRYKRHIREINCNKFYCNLTFYKLNTYLILTSACLVLWSKNVSTDKNFLRNILVTRGDPFVCACLRLRSSHCGQTNVESSSLYFWSPENKLCGEVGWVYPCEDKVSI